MSLGVYRTYVCQLMSIQQLCYRYRPIRTTPTLKVVRSNRIGRTKESPRNRSGFGDFCYGGDWVKSCGIHRKIIKMTLKNLTKAVGETF